MLGLSRPYPFKFSKGCFPQILLGPFLNTLSQILLILTTKFSLMKLRILKLSLQYYYCLHLHSITTKKNSWLVFIHKVHSEYGYWRKLPFCGNSKFMLSFVQSLPPKISETHFRFGNRYESNILFVTLH